MENITFYKQINLFLENKCQRKLSAYVHSLKACVRRHELRTQVGFQKPMKGKFYALKIDVWNESHIVWEPF